MNNDEVPLGAQQDVSALQAAFRARKSGAPLQPEEAKALRDYHAKRRQKSIYVAALDVEEARRWRQLARQAGHKTSGEWAAAIIRTWIAQQEERRTELERWKARSYDAEREVAKLREKVRLLSLASPANRYWNES